MEAKPNLKTPHDAITDASEVAALCETVAQYVLRLRGKAHGTWAAMAMDDLADTAIDIKTRANDLIKSEEDVTHE